MSGVERFELTAVFEPDEDGWIFAYIEEMPGVFTCGRTREEATSLLPDALREYLLAIGQSQQPHDEGPAAERVPLAVTFDV